MLADYQQALALLLVDRELRALLRDDPAALAAAWQTRGLALDGDELTSLRALDPDAVERCAAGLATKRRRAIAAAVPHSARLWPALGSTYGELLAASPARVEHLDVDLGPALSELLRFRAELVARARRDSLAPPWTAALLELELARACALRDGRERALTCAYPVHEALVALDRGWLSCALEPRPSAYLVGPERLRWRPLPINSDAPEAER